MTSAKKKIGSYIFSVCGLEIGKGREGGIYPWRKGAYEYEGGVIRPPVRARPPD